MNTKTIQRVVTIVVCVVVMFMTSASQAGQKQRIRMQDGSIWKGSINSQVEVSYRPRNVTVKIVGRLTKIEKRYIEVVGKIAGIQKKKIIMRSNLMSMKTLKGPSDSVDVSGSKVADLSKPDPPSIRSADRQTRDTSQGQSESNRPHIFLLPLSGFVGTYFRHNEIDMIGKEADKYGDHQIIILEIDSGGGSVRETERIHHSLVSLTKRHRVVAWIKHATSAACATAMHCQEIYFMTEGQAGAMTAFGGGVAIQGAELQNWLDTASEWMEHGGRKGMIARAMIKKEFLLSYTRNPDTGEVTWFDDLSGDVILSTADQNLEFTSSTAIDSGFAQGIADTHDDLAKLLDLPAWPEGVDYGRNMIKKWSKKVKKCEEDVPLLLQQLSYKNQSDPDPIVRLGTRLGIWRKLRGWCVQAEPVMLFTFSLLKEDCDRQIEALKRQIARLKR